MPSYKVQSKEKGTGRLVLSPAFGSLTAAQAYARTVKDGTVIPVDVEAPVVQVKTCPDSETARAQQRLEAQCQIDQERASLSERAAEAYMEAGSQARLGGASTSDALDYAADAAAQVVTDSTVARACAGGCGRTVRGGFTTCRRCAR